MSTKESQMVARVVVLGAGYAGMSAVRRLSRQNGVHVTLVNPRPDFVERIRLHQLLVGNHPAVRPLRELIPTSVDLEVTTAESIDAAAQRVSLGSGATVDYDYLVYAIGSRSAPSDIPGAGVHAHTIDTVESATATRRVLRELRPASTVTVVGGGLTGLETAAEVVDSTGLTVRLVTRGVVGPSIGEKARETVRRHLAGKGVELVEHDAVEHVTDANVVLVSGRTLTSDLTIVTPSFEFPDLARTSGLAIDTAGALEVHTTLVSTSHSTIVGAGDAAVIADAPVRMSCQAALPLGVHAAETVLHLLAGRDPRPVQRKFAGQCISLGRGAAVFQVTDRADTPRPRLVLTGRAGALLKEQICSSTMTFGHVGKFSYSWT